MHRAPLARVLKDHRHRAWISCRAAPWALVACGLFGALAGCSGAQAPGAAGTALFLPPLPNKPRLQFLASYTSAADIEERSAIADFLVGADGEVPELRKPNAAIFLKDRIVVADTGSRNVLVFDLVKGEFRPLRGNTAGGRVKQPLQIAVAPDGMIFVSDGIGRQVHAYREDEQFVRAYGAEGDMRPAGVAATRDTLYVCDLAKHQIVVFDRETGTIRARLGAEGREPGQFYIPTNIAIGPDGDLYVSETGNFRVQRVHPDGTSVRVYGALGDQPGTFSRPRGVAVDPAGIVYAVDAAFENVQVFDPEARLLLFFGGSGDGAGQFVLPSGISVSAAPIAHYQKIADPRLKLKYVMAVVSQYGPRRISVFGFGDWTGEFREPPTRPPAPAPATAVPEKAPAPAPAVPEKAPAPAPAVPEKTPAPAPATPEKAADPSGTAAPG